MTYTQSTDLDTHRQSHHSHQDKTDRNKDTQLHRQTHTGTQTQAGEQPDSQDSFQQDNYLDSNNRWSEDEGTGRMK